MVEEQKYNYDLFYYRLESALRNKGYDWKKPADIAKALKVNQGNVFRWKNGTIPSVDTLMKICNICDCDIDYLLGRINTIKRANQSIQEETGLSEEAIEILRAENTDNRNDFEKEWFPRKSPFITFVDAVIKDGKPIADSLNRIDNNSVVKSIIENRPDIANALAQVMDADNGSNQRFSIFKQAFMESNPTLPDDEITNDYVAELFASALYLCSGGTDAERYSMNQRFEFIINKLLSGNPASEDK